MDELFPDLHGRVLAYVPLAQLPRALRALQLACMAWRTAIDRDDLWRELLETRLAITVHAAAARRSERLITTARGDFARTWRAAVERCEHFHHAIACLGQDSQNLTVSRLKQALAPRLPWLLPNRASPIYRATVLMEVCRAKDIREATLVALAEHLVTKLGVDPSAGNEDGCTPLIITASRGLPKLTAFLLACGADPRPRGTGRFRLHNTAKSVRGTHSASEWAAELDAREAELGVSLPDRRPLHLCRLLLDAQADGPLSAEPDPRTCAAAMISMATSRADASRLLKNKPWAVRGPCSQETDSGR